jgi:glycosyltransferase involved in cell wall biosynthesis
MFEASHRFEFLDYYRVPYQLVPDEPAMRPAESLDFIGRLRSARQDGSPGRSLLWFRSGAGAPQMGGSCALGRYRLGSATLFGHVLSDSAAMAWLPALGTGWRPTQPLRNETGAHVASVWRDEGGNVFLPFDMGEVMGTFWSERYEGLLRSPHDADAKRLLLRAYYRFKPFTPRSAQLALRRALARVQSRSSFPRWPIEDSLHDLYTWLLAVLADLCGSPVPWLDMWPGGRSWALVLTHDVETEIGFRNLHLLRDPERSAGFRSSWNFVPERYRIEECVLQRLRDEGCEIGVHGLRHDGRDLSSRRFFDQRLPAIRGYAERWGAVGYRSPATHRVWEWMPELGFDYDSSYTDTDPYEPQRGGCCTYLPFMNQNQVELPITLPQDHTVFAVLRHTDESLWVNKARHLRDRGAMALVLSHPDYAHDPYVAGAWKGLLDEFRDDDSAWQALPREVAAWWRRRASSAVGRSGGEWRVEGPAAGDGRVRFTEPDTSVVTIAGGDRATAAWAEPGETAPSVPHVLIIVENTPLGADVRVRKEVDDLLAAGYRVSVVSQSAPQNDEYRIRPGLTLLEYPPPRQGQGILGYVWEYATSLAWAVLHSGRARLRTRVDILQLIQPPDIYVPLSRVHKLFGATILIDQHDLMPELLALRQKRAVRPATVVLRWLERLTQSIADETICTNDYQRARLIDAGGDPDRVTVVRNGPVVGRVRHAVPDESLREGYSFLCCWVGKMGRQDRLDLALSAVRLVVQDLGRKDIKFAFLGNGECLDEAKALSSQLGLDRWVSFPGWVPESTVFSYLATADLGMDASLQEDVSPVKVFEYMAFGIPFVSFDVQETRAVGAGAGAYVPPGDLESMAHEIVTLLDDPHRRAEMGRTGRERVRDELAWEHQAKEYLRVIDRLSARARREQPRR